MDVRRRSGGESNRVARRIFGGRWANFPFWVFILDWVVNHPNSGIIEQALHTQKCLMPAHRASFWTAIALSWAITLFNPCAMCDLSVGQWWRPTWWRRQLRRRRWFQRWWRWWLTDGLWWRGRRWWNRTQ